MIRSVQPQKLNQDALKSSLLPNIGLTNSITFRSVQPHNDNVLNRQNIHNQHTPPYNSRFRATTP